MTPELRSSRRGGRPGAKQAGQTLVQTALLIAIVGVVVAVFIPTFFRAVRTSKTSEATEELQALYQRSASYFARPFETEAGRVRQCLPPAGGPTPSVVSYDAKTVVFAEEKNEGHETWAALGYQPERAIRYRYTFIPTHDGCGLKGGQARSDLTLRAEGDLDADGRLSRYERDVVIEGEQLRPNGVLTVRDATE